MKFKRSRK